MSYVYLLSNHREDGAEEVGATLIRESLPRLLEGRLAGYTDEFQSQAREKLPALLRKSDEELAAGEFGHGHSLMYGWGGEQLHVVKLS